MWWRCFSEDSNFMVIFPEVSGYPTKIDIVDGESVLKFNHSICPLCTNVLLIANKIRYGSINGPYVLIS